LSLILPSQEHFQLINTASSPPTMNGLG
jgi:hypothetical protein